MDDEKGALAVCRRICALRRQVCPRTSYATAGAATSELIMAVDAVGSKNAALFRENMLKFNEFTSIKEVISVSELSSAMQGHVAIYLAPFPSAVTSSIENEINDYIFQFKRLLSEKKSNLIALVVPLGSYRDSMSEAIIDGTKYSVITEEYSNEYKVLIAYCKAVSIPLNSGNMQGNHGQPSVKSRGQFKFLWDSARDGKDNIDFGKQRVLQRLSDRPIHNSVNPSAETKLTISEWDEIIGRMIYQEKLDDFGIYNHLRKLYVGTTLVTDLEISNTNSNAASASRNDDDEGGAGGDGRASYLVSLTVNCIPSKYKSNIKSILDYGCAEGAITGQLCKQLQVVASSAYGADVRYLPAVGFQFLQLPAETETPGSVGSILPSIRDHSIDFINSAMVFHHVRHVPAALAELRRVISDQGVFVVREHHCTTPFMAAFLDITHGLYSLCWKIPVEWPAFLDEYEAWYRGREEWNQYIEDAGFRPLAEVEMTEDGIRQYNSAQISVPKANHKGITVTHISYDSCTHSI